MKNGLPTTGQYFYERFVPSTPYYKLPEYREPNDVGIEPSCPLFRLGEKLGASLERSRLSLEQSLVRLEGSSQTPLLGSKRLVLDRGLSYYLPTLKLATKVAARKDERLLPIGQKDPLHQEVAQFCAFSRALEQALKGDLTEVESVALDHYFPAFPSCASQAARVTGLGCAIFGLGSAIGGGIVSYLVDDASKQ